MTERQWLGFIFGLYILFAFAYSWLMPPWEGPDEPSHYILAVNLARVNIFSSIERNYEAGQPQTYYRIASVPLKALYQLNRDWVAVIYPEKDFGNVRKPAPIFFWSDENYQFLPGLYLLRWLNILIGAGALGLNYAAMRRFALKKTDFYTVPLAALALASLTPQFLHTTSSVSNDVLGILAGAFLFWVLSLITTKSISLAALGVAVVLAFLLPYITKLTVLPVGIAVVIAIILQVRNRWRTVWRWIVIGGMVLGSGTLLLGVWLIPHMGELFIQQVVWRAFTISNEALSSEYLWEMVKQVVWSYWGLVGWLSVRLPGWVVVLWTGIGLLGVGAVGVKRREAGSEGVQERGRGGEWVLWMVAGLSVLAVLKNGLNTVNSQGRFLFPAIGALCLLMVRGWQLLLPERYQRFLLPAIILLMVASNLILWLWGILPVYYQPFID